MSDSMLKVDLHAHTASDPCDYIAHSTRGLIDRASALGYDALAVTLHDRYYDPSEDRDYGESKGVLLIAGVERTLDRRHVLLVNFPAECATVRDFADLRELKARNPHGLVVAPHAFYPIASALSGEVERWADVIDALEVNSMFTSWLNFNTRAVRWAREHGKPLVGNTDLHLLAQMGTTYSLVDAPRNAGAICDAIRAGRVEVRSTPLSAPRAASYFLLMLAGGVIGRFRRTDSA
jgi:predicted metal-dependent phosphoesterase TrpH